MLHAAGALTLELAQGALEEGFGLKDATPYNVLFRGSRPVFVDVLSFEAARSAGCRLDGLWAICAHVSAAADGQPLFRAASASDAGGSARRVGAGDGLSMGGAAAAADATFPESGHAADMAGQEM